MSIPGSVNPLFLGAAGQATGGGEYQIERSVRFNSPDSAYLSRTPASSSNLKTWSWAGWVKRSKLGTTQRFFATFDGSNQEYWRFDSNDTLRLFESLGTLQTTQVFRDVSAWYHIVVAVDTTQATASDRIKFYLNGTQVTTFSTATYPSQNADGRFNSAVPHYLGTGTVEYFDGYLADIHFIDGQALDPSSFGEFDTNGVWQPIEYTFSTNPNWATATYLSSTSNFPGYPVANGFDGSTSTEWLQNTQGGTVTFSNISIPYSSTVKIWVGGSGATVSVNGGAGQSISPGSWVTVASGSGTLTSLAWTANGAEYPALVGIQIDGYTLISGDNSFHLPFSDNSTAAALGTDTSSNGNDWTVNNLAVASTVSFSSYRTTFDSTDTLGIAGGSWFNPNNTSQWTIEGWVFSPSSTSAFSIFSGTNGAIANFGFSIGHVVSFQSGNGGWAWVTNTTLVANTGNLKGWCHFAGVRNGSQFEVFLNGLRIYSGTLTFGTGGTGGTVWINSYFNDGTYYTPGQVSNLRIIQGTALYSGISCQIPTGPLSAITGTTLLTLQSATFVDNSTNNLTITTYGTPTISSATISQDGTSNDSLVDSPTNGSQVDTGVGGEVVGNYCTLNPLDNGGALVLTNGNLEAENTTADHDGCRCTIKLPSSGKWYYEGTVLSPFSGTTANMLGVATGTSANPGLGASGTYYILVNASGAVQRYIAGGSTNYTGFSTPAIGSVLQVAYDADSGKLWFGLNNLWMDGSSGVTGSPSTGSNETVSSVYDVFPSTSQYSTKIAVNFGQRQWAYAAPAGFKALCTTNLPEPTIADGSTAMDVATYTGNGSTQTISGLNFSPDLVWIKRRDGTAWHFLYDTVRGTGNKSSDSATTLFRSQLRFRLSRRIYE
jgi:hypothetical protein